MNGYKVVVSGHMASRDSESKAKIRKKATEKSDRPVIVIPPKSDDELRKVRGRPNPGRKIRVAGYCRVSTPSENQLQSIENQKMHFDELFEKHSDEWEPVGIYADEGITGTSRKKRKSFNAMIEACHRGEIDLILIKDVARYARNVVDGLGVARELRSLNPPVGIYFETLDLSTLRPDYETLLSIMITCSQAESIAKSEAMKWSYKHRFENGRFPCLTYYLLGYDTDEEGNMVIETEGAKTVKVIFFAYCLGYSIDVIADMLTKASRRTGWKGKDEEGNVVYNTHWSRQAIISILENERYCGDALGQKTYIQDPLTHKKLKNNGNMPSYFIENHHKGIVSHEVFEMAQKILCTEPFRKQEQMKSYNLSVVQKGFLKGFVPLNVFSAFSNYAEYLELCETVDWPEEELGQVSIPVIGNFIKLRSAFGEQKNAIKLTFTGKKIVPNKNLLNVMKGTEHFEILLHPEEYLVAIRKTDKNNPNAVRWADWSGGSPKEIRAVTGSMSETIFDLMNWERDWKFTCEGDFRTKGDETIVVFDLRDTMAYVPRYSYDEAAHRHVFKGWNKPIFPCHWKDNIYGDSFQKAVTKCRMHLVDYFGVWDIDAKAVSNKKYDKRNPVSVKEYKSAFAELQPQTEREVAFG